MASKLICLIGSYSFPANASFYLWKPAFATGGYTDSSGDRLPEDGSSLLQLETPKGHVRDRGNQKEIKRKSKGDPINSRDPLKLNSTFFNC